MRLAVIREIKSIAIQLLLLFISGFILFQLSSRGDTLSQVFSNLSDIFLFLTVESCFLSFGAFIHTVSNKNSSYKKLAFVSLVPALFLLFLRILIYNVVSSTIIYD